MNKYLCLPSQKKTKKPTSPLAVPGQPQNISAAFDDPDSITVTRQEPTVLSGIVVINITDAEGTLISMVNATGTIQTLEGLSPFTLYSIQVAAITGTGAGNSVTAEATTAEDDKWKTRLSNYTIVVWAFTVAFGPTSDAITVLTGEDGSCALLMVL